MTGQYKTSIARAASGLACAVACTALIGCATQPSPPPKSATPAATPSAARPATRSESSTQQATRTAKAPTLRESVPRLAQRARAENWSHEEFLVACLQREVAARESHGGEERIRAARFPARKSLEEFDFDHARGLKRDTIAHLGTLDFVAAKDNVVFLGPPGTWICVFSSIDSTTASIGGSR